MSDPEAPVGFDDDVLVGDSAREEPAEKGQSDIQVAEPDPNTAQQHSSISRFRLTDPLEDENGARDTERPSSHGESQNKDYLALDELPLFWNPWDRTFSIRRPSDDKGPRPLTVSDAFRDEEYLRQLSEQLSQSKTEHRYAGRRGKQADWHQYRPGEGAEVFRDIALRLPPYTDHESLVSSGTEEQARAHQREESDWDDGEDGDEENIRRRRAKALASTMDRMEASCLPNELLAIGQLDHYAPYPMSSGAHASIIPGNWDPDPDQGRIGAGFNVEALQRSSYRYKAYSTFTYKPVKHRHIRLLRFVENPVPALRMVFVELLEVPLDEAPPYEALSYRWSNEQPPRSINCNGKALTVSANLQEALRRLNVVDRLLWADAICINQDDVEEKGEQVTLMAEIYSRALRVLVWLGEGRDPDTSMYLSYMEMARDGQTRSSGAQNPVTTTLEDDDAPPPEGLLHLLQRSYFSRVWVLQEVALARDIVLHCGTQVASWAALASFLRRMNERSRLPRAWRPAWNLVTFRYLYQRGKGAGGVDIYSAMVQSRFCLASDPRDKIYARLGVCGELAALVGRPNYAQSVDEVWTRAARACLLSSLSTGALALVTSEPGEGHAPAARGPPSWTPDPNSPAAAWMRRPVPQDPPDGVPPLSFCSASSRCLHVRGLLADSVSAEPHRGGPAQTDAAAVWRAWWQVSQGLDEALAPSHEQRARAFWETLAADSGPAGWPSSLLHRWHDAIIWGQESAGDELSAVSSPTSPETRASSRSPFPGRGLQVSDLADITLARAFCLLQSRTIALVPKNTHVGDVVALLSGASMPFILRRVHREEGATSRGSVDDCVRQGSPSYRWQVIGPCYVYGLSTRPLEASECIEFVIV